MKTFKGKLRIVFEGNMTIKAKTVKEAVKIAGEGFSCFLGGNPNTSKDEILDWDIAPRPNIYLMNLKKQK